jgi:two-component system sensor histidine kinase FlrB
MERSVTIQDQHAARLAEAFAVFNQTSTQLESAYRELEGQVAELSRELDSRKRLAAVGEVAATLAHQLRTPLSSALLYLAPLESGELTGARAAEYASKTVARLRQIESQINDMLTFTRGGQSGSEAIAPGELLEAVTQVLEPRLDDATLTVEDATGGGMLRGNREALTGALLNLADNALQAAGPDVRIHIRAACTEAGVEIAVSDNGPGIAAPAREKLFEPFFTTRSNGTGLGLAIVQSVVEAHDGSIVARPSETGGAKFTIRLPLAEAGTPLASGAKASEACYE